MFGYAPAEIIGQDVSVLVPDPRHALPDAFVTGSSEAGNRIGASREVEGRRKDGSSFPVELSVSEIRHDKELLFIGFARDLSERRRFEARLSKLHANRLNSMADMATALAHELNQPLAAATNYFALARQIAGAGSQPPMLGEALEKASGQLLRAGQIIAHLREFITRGEPNRVEQSLHALIRSACDLVAPLMRELSVELTLRLDAAEDEVLADRIHIEQALINLIRNAMEAMANSEERKLAISTSLQDGMVRTDVTDTGRGLSEQSNVDLFVPFTSTKRTGLGVGLSISRSIVEAHYGAIWAEANPAGRGAQFSFTLPLGRLERAEYSQ